MYTLRTIFKEGVQVNQNLGNTYTFVDNLGSPEEFQKTKEMTNYNEIEEIYGFIISERGNDIHPLRNQNRYFIMTEGGTTFCNLSR